LRKRHDILTCFCEDKGAAFLDSIWGKKPLFVCVIGTTETAKIPGLSAAGANPEVTDYTPPADVEFLQYGECRCMEGVPVTPEGIPTPALITRVALKLASIPLLVLNAGVKVRPEMPYVEVGGRPGGDIRSGKAVEDAKGVFLRSMEVGRTLSEMVDYLVVGESIPGGTTTALALLLAMGISAEGKVSSSMPVNPHDLKVEVAYKAIGVAGLSSRAGPFGAVSAVGDPMIPVAAGMICGAAERVPVLMAGGTQMCAVLNLIKHLSPHVLPKLAIGTTRWIVQDRTSDIQGLVSQIAPVPVLAIDLDFSKSKFEGLRAYERGFVKEGVGAGGSCIAAIAKTKGSLDGSSLLREIERSYEWLLGKLNRGERTEHRRA